MIKLTIKYSKLAIPDIEYFDKLEEAKTRYQEKLSNRYVRWMSIEEYVQGRDTLDEHWQRITI